MGLGSSSAEDSRGADDRTPADSAPFEIGDWRVEPDRFRVSRGSEARKLEPMAMRLLIFLASRPAEILSRAEILEEVWEGRAVVDETLSRSISLVRHALEDNAQQPRYIETLPRRGYRLIATVKHHEVPPEDSSSAARSVSPPTGIEGPRTETHRWRTPIVLVLLLAAVALWWVGRDPKRSGRATAPAPADVAETPRRPGIAVLPFKDLSPDPEKAYLAAGLTEELIHQLASISGLRVVSRTSSMHFQNSDALAPEIAETLGVDYLLEGTVLAVDQRLRITAQLIRPDLDEHLLSRSYDRAFSEVLDLQREVAKDVVERTRTELSPTEATRLDRGPSINAEGYRAYLQGQQVVQRRGDFDRGIELLEHAIELEPGFAPAWSALANAHLLSNSYLGRSEASAYPAAEAAIERALRLDPVFAPAHASLGLLRLQRDRDWAGSEASYKRAIELEPSDVTAHQWYSELLSILGRHREALDKIGIALELDPLSALVHGAAGQRLNAAGRHEHALARLEDAQALGANSRWIYREKAWALGHLGRRQESLEILATSAIRRRDRFDDQQVAALHRATREQGLIGYYTWEVQNYLAASQRRPGFPTWLAAAYAGSGQPEAALEWLAKAVPEQNLWLPHTLKSPAFNALRDDPRFIEVLGDVPPWRPETVRSNEIE